MKIKLNSDWLAKKSAFILQFLPFDGLFVVEVAVVDSKKKKIDGNIKRKYSPLTICWTHTAFFTELYESVDMIEPK